MSTAAEPPMWMPGMWDKPIDGFPMRHRPLRPSQDTWFARCGAQCFHFCNQSVVVNYCRECPECTQDD